MGQLDGKVAVITGAGSGMAKASVKVFVREGAKVVAADVSGAEKDTAAEVGEGVLPVHCDVTKEDDIEAAVRAAVEEYGRLDVMLNVAGIADGGRIVDLTQEQYDRMMDVDLRGVIFGMKHGIRAMKKRGKGSVINLSSVSGIVGQGFIHVGYNASKGAVRLLSKAGAAQHGRDNIRVNSVHPGLMPPMRTSGRTADPATRAKTLKGVPLGRAGEVDEVASAILFLASDESSFVTGQSLLVDGGITAAYVTPL